MVNRSAGRLGDDQEFLVFEHNREIRRDIGFGIVLDMVKHLVVLVRYRIRIRNFPVNGHKSPP
jgi:hypothetical protein